MSDNEIADPRPVVLITGASHGIGHATAKRLAARGWRVFAASRSIPTNEPPPASQAEAVRQGGELIPLRVDVREPDSVRIAVDELLARSDERLDAVVANAGIAAVGMFEDTPADVMAALMETNYFGVLNTVREALPALHRSRGRIVVLSSDAGIYGSPGLSGYSASKFALEGWAESAAYELWPTGVRLSIVQPGPFRTDIWHSQLYLPASGPRRELAELLAANWSAAAATAGDPERVAATVERALTAERPKLRYTVGRNARQAAVLRRALPPKLFIRWVEHANGIGKATSGAASA